MLFLFSSSSTLSGAKSQKQQPKQRRQDFHHPRHFLQHSGRTLKPSKARSHSLPACPDSPSSQGHMPEASQGRILNATTAGSSPARPWGLHRVHSHRWEWDHMQTGKSTTSPIDSALSPIQRCGTSILVSCISVSLSVFQRFIVLSAVPSLHSSLPLVSHCFCPSPHQCEPYSSFWCINSLSSPPSFPLFPSIPDVAS